MEGRERRRVARRALIAAGVAASVLSVTGLTLGLRSADTPTQSTAAPAPGAAGSSSTEASALLMQIARVAQAAPLDVPRPDQFTYAKTLTLDPKVSYRPGPGKCKPGSTEPCEGGNYRVSQFTGDIATLEVWTPQTPGDNGLIRTESRGKTEDEAYSTGPGQRAGIPDLGTYAGLREVPTDDSRALVAAILTNSKRTDEDTDATVLIRNIEELGLLEQVLPPDFAAATYRALAALPDITVTKDVVDLAGRTGVAIGATNRVGERYELIFDPTTSAPLGSREFGVKAGPRSRQVEDFQKDPNISTQETAIITVATVDRAGQLPPK